MATESQTDHRAFAERIRRSWIRRDSDGSKYGSSPAIPDTRKSQSDAPNESQAEFRQNPATAILSHGVAVSLDSLRGRSTD